MEKITINGIVHMVDQPAGDPAIGCTGEYWWEEPIAEGDFTHLKAEPVKRLREITCPRCLQKAMYYRNVLK